MTREARLLELQELKRSHPERLIALFRSVANIDELGQLPYGVSFTSMIEQIVEHEQLGTFDREHFDSA